MLRSSSRIREARKEKGSAQPRWSKKFGGLSDVGTAALYSPPYSPTACYGSDASQFPSSNLFAAAGDGIWNNGAACGRLYLVRVHGEDVVPLARGPVSPSAPNPTTDDRRIHGEDVVPLARGPVSPSAPNPTTEDAVGHYP
uniref:Expansin-like EG45 domain-containing protein n=1 Tax=Quercus lobata TaxID=97700 RepID=A0A7N2L7J4_QUELO